MKKQWNVIVVLSAIALLGGLFWLIRAPRAVRPSVALAFVTSSLKQSSSGAIFRVTNRDKLGILMTDLIVETNSPAGWQAFSHTTPTRPEWLATGETKDLVIAPPDGEKSWRLRVTYGKDVKGPMLLLVKAAHAIYQGTWPGRGFSAVGGSNSCISGEMTR